MEAWSEAVDRVKNKTKLVIVAANNHYAGFGSSSTANSFRKMVGLKEVVWDEMKQK